MRCSTGPSVTARGLRGPAPQPRHDRGQSRAIDPQLASLIERLKRENPHRTGTTLLRELALSSGKGEPPLSASTLYRFLKQHGLSEKQLLAPGAAHKKFEAEFSNRIAPRRRPQAGLSSCHARRCQPPHPARPVLYQSGARCRARLSPPGHGLPRHTYPALHRQRQDVSLATTGPHCRLAGHAIVHSCPYQPEGRGKIERCFRTVREQFLASLDPKRLLTLDELNERLWVWIENAYHRSPHSALGTTPLLRWQRDIEQVRQLPPAAGLRRLFFHRLDRLVRRDSTFLLHGRLYEAPPHLAGRTVEVRFDPFDSAEVEIWFQGQQQAAARLLDAVANAQMPAPPPREENQE